MRWLRGCLGCLGWWVVVVAGCGGAPPPPPKVAEVAVTGPASFAGSWVTADDLDWGYTLKIEPDGGLLLTIDRGKMGRCEQKGVLAPGADARSYQLTYAKNTCNPDVGGMPLSVEVASFTGAALSLAITGDGTVQRRTYQRDPKSTAP